ncbi:hypothetical protein BD626DRAFT_509389 [Schizophyllum amplum]|uniref:Uncharacterized protein n=1 Tax=Schizophyllum amplum TaxID=97359 RepID=A0A550C2G9_9AGAR|nr:hypothetical protein BD626DRAFT_509389 [Auriculariopsis ampla]
MSLSSTSVPYQSARCASIPSIVFRSCREAMERISCRRTLHRMVHRVGAMGNRTSLRCVRLAQD